MASSSGKFFCSYYLLAISLLSILSSFLVTDVHCVHITSVRIPSHYALEDGDINDKDNNDNDDDDDNDNDDNDDDNDDDDDDDDNDDNKKEPLVLDCLYELDNNETSLLVKWFKDDQAIYQWIYGTDPKAFPQMRNRINESYIASHDDPWQRHRAVQFIDPGLDLTGDYKCVIQTAQSADSKISHLEILDMTNITFKLNTEERDDDTLVTCLIANIKPKPTLELRLNQNEEIEIDHEEIFNNTEGFYQVTVKGNISNEKIDSDSEFGCLLSFEGTNFTKWYSELHLGGSTASHRLSFGLLSSSSFLSSILVVIASTFLRDILI